MPIPVFINRMQVKKVCDLVCQDMTMFLGYEPMIQGVTKNNNNDVCFQIELLDQHDTDEMRTYFNERVWLHLRAISKLYEG